MSAGFDIDATGAETLLRVSGEIDLANAGELYGILLDNAGERRLVVDLSSLVYIDSAGLAALHRAYRELRDEHREIALVLPPDAPCARTFEIVSLDLPILPELR
jgi:anti-sigma B factor antagonist